MRPTKQKYQRIRLRTIHIKQLLFLGFLVLMCFIGLLWFFRPKTSVVENRNLTEFPTPTLLGVLDGSFFSDIAIWYADTYPLREGLIDQNAKLQQLYGIRTQRLVTNGEKADAIPTGPVDLEALAGQTTEAADTTQSTAHPAPSDTAAPVSVESGASSPVTTDPQAPETTAFSGHGAADVTGELEKAGNNIYILDGAGYGVYFFSEKNSARYCLLVNKLAKNLAGKAQVYSMLCPISAGVMLSDEVRDSTGSSDENAAAEWFYQNMDPSVKTVSMVNTLRAHNDEYIFFRTDHHWTALGAYYAYREWCKVKGVTPHELSDFQTYTFDGFLGTFYSSSNKDASMAAKPDTVTAYIPNGTNQMQMYVANKDGTFTEYAWRVVNDVSNYAKSQLYAAFAGGDQAYNYVHNEAITDGSSVLIVKDSYANAFIPFLIDHYEYIYWIDFRNYKKWCKWAGYADPSISALVERKSIQDVILCQNISIAGSSSALDVMEGIFK